MLEKTDVVFSKNGQLSTGGIGNQGVFFRVFEKLLPADSQNVSITEATVPNIAPCQLSEKNSYSKWHIGLLNTDKK